MLALIVILPLLLGIVAISFIRDIAKMKYVAIAAGAVALMLMPLVSYGTTSVNWFSIGSFGIDLTIAVTPLNFLLLSLVILIGLLVLVYSSGYIRSVFEQRRFYVEMLAFETAMATFAVSGNFVVLFIAWEFLSLTSYLLIGFLYHKNSANRAARKALTIIFMGDLALIASIALFWNAFGTLEFAQIIAATQIAHVSVALYSGSLLLLFAVLTKSAQFPFHEWLIDAMEGPTPVSAYLHSSTMVKAGVFTVILLYPLFRIGAVGDLLFASSAITLVLATLAASREMHIKKVIAYSTIQELSIMMLALSVGAVLPAIFFFFVQSFYKALLFFSSGVAMEASGKEDINEIYGLNANRMLYISTLFGVLSLAGFIPFSGFFANEGISLAIGNEYVRLLLAGISLLTSFYIVRWFSYLSRSGKRSQVLAGNYVSASKNMIYPIAALAVLTLAASGLFFSITGFLGYGGALSYLSLGNSMPFSATDSVMYLVIIAFGAALGYFTYYKNSIKIGIGYLGRIIYTGPIVNLFYDLIAVITSGFSSGVSEFDQRLSSFYDRIGSLVLGTGGELRKASVGNINYYAIIFIIGLLIMLASFYYLVIV